MSSPDISKTLNDIFTVIGFILVIGLIFALPVMLLWDWLMPKIFGLPEITFWQSLGVNLLSGILFRNHTSKK